MTDDTTTRLALAEQRARISLAAAGAMLVAGVLLMAILIALEWWRTHDAFHRHAFAFNGLVMTGGFMLVGYQ